MLDNKHKYGWRVMYSLAIAASAFLATELPTNAVPKTPIQIAQVRSRAIAPRPLNVTPLPGRHIPLPHGRSSYGYHYDYDFYGDYAPRTSRGDRYRRHRYYHRPKRFRGDTTIIIINPDYSDYSRYRYGDRLRIIRP